MSTFSTLAELLKSARRRSVNHSILRLAVWTLAITLGVSALILLLGSQLLGWFWAPIALLASATAGWIVTRKKLPSLYEVAQDIDGRLNLADSLSTASYFESAPAGTEAAVRDAQHAYAEKLAPSVDLKQALPFKRPTSLYPAIGLAMLVCGLFGVRYAAMGSFDSRPSLVKNALDNLLGAPKQQALNPQKSDGMQPGDNSQDQAESKNADYAGDSQFDPSAPESQFPQPSQDKDKSDKKESNDDKMAGNDTPGQDQDKSGDQKKQNGSESNVPNSQANSDPSLLDKVKQAMNDLMNKMKSPGDQKNQKGDPQTDADKQPGQDGQSPDKSQGEGSDAQKNAQQSADAEKGQTSAQNTQSNESQQGFGSQEGDKNVKQAEALKAMGKISQILGKRAENVKGSVTMEVGQTKQQLKTASTEISQSHSDAGGEIHRDTVPPAYEQFVQQYFEEVRKATSTKPAKSPTSPTPIQ